MGYVGDKSLEVFHSKDYKSRLDELKNNHVFVLREDGNFDAKRTPEFGMRNDVREFIKMMEHVIKQSSDNPGKNTLLYFDDNSRSINLSIDSKPSTVMIEINKKIRNQLQDSEKKARRADLQYEESSEASRLLFRLKGRSEATELMKELTKPSEVEKLVKELKKPSEVEKLMGRLNNSPPKDGLSR